MEKNKVATHLAGLSYSCGYGILRSVIYEVLNRGFLWFHHGKVVLETDAR